MSSEISPFDNANVLTFMHNTSEMGIEIDSFCFKRPFCFKKKSNDSYLFTGAAGAANMISVMAVVDCCWKQKNRGNSAKKKKNGKKNAKTCILHSLAVPIHRHKKTKSIRSAFTKLRFPPHCVASQRLSLTSTSKAPLASMEALLLLGTDSIGTGRIASSSSSPLCSFAPGIEVVER